MATMEAPIVGNPAGNPTLQAIDSVISEFQAKFEEQKTLLENLLKIVEEDNQKLANKQKEDTTHALQARATVYQAQIDGCASFIAPMNGLPEIIEKVKTFVQSKANIGVPAIQQSYSKVHEALLQEQLELQNMLKQLDDRKNTCENEKEKTASFSKSLEEAQKKVKSFNYNIDGNKGTFTMIYENVTNTFSRLNPFGRSTPAPTKQT